MVEAAIELVEHPGCDAFERKQAAAARDLIAIVEHGMTGLLSPVEGEMTGCDLDKSSAALGNAGGVPAVCDGADPRLLLTERLCRIGVRITELLGDEPLERGVVLTEEGAPIGGEPCRPPLMVGVEPSRNRLRPPLVRHGPSGEHAGGTGQAVAIERAFGTPLGEQSVRCRTLGHAEPGPERPDRAFDTAMTRYQRRETIPLTAHVCQQGTEALLAGNGSHGGKGGGESVVNAGPGVAQQACARRAKECSTHALVGDLEIGSNARLKRKAPQQRLAERVDGLDLEPVGHIEHGGEEAARAVERGLRGFCPGQHLERSGERVIVGDSPASEIARDSERHLGGGRAGEGEAEDALGRRAPQQQPQHAVRQHLGLARAGRGTDPDRGRRIRGPVLSRRHPGRLHGHHGSPPGTDHSLCRARWA